MAQRGPGPMDADPGMLPCHPGGEAINARPVLPFQGRLAELLFSKLACPGIYCEVEVQWVR